jgi:hypothetical protein
MPLEVGLESVQMVGLAEQPHMPLRSFRRTFQSPSREPDMLDTSASRPRLHEDGRYNERSQSVVMIPTALNATL